jgi:hypothetical protein
MPESKRHRILNEKIADMGKVDYSKTEQIAELNREIELQKKKIQDLDFKLKKYTKRGGAEREETLAIKSKSSERLPAIGSKEEAAKAMNTTTVSKGKEGEKMGQLVPIKNRGRKDEQKLNSEDEEDEEFTRDKQLALLPDESLSDELYTEEFLKEITLRAERGEKRELMYLIIVALESNRTLLKQAVLRVLAYGQEKLGITHFDMMNGRIHIKLLKLLSIKNPLEYSEEMLKDVIVILSYFMKESATTLMEDFRKEEKSISWKKIISILKLFMSKNKEEEAKFAACRVFLLLVKNHYYDDLIFSDKELFGYLIRTFQDSNMNLKGIIAKIIESYCQNEKDYTLKTKKLRIPLEYVKKIGSNFTDLLCRYRDPELIQATLRPLDILCFNRNHVPYLKENNIVDRLLDFCKNPIASEITIFSLNLLIKFVEASEEKSKAVNNQLTVVVEGLKTFLKSTQVTSDPQMLGVILNLVNKVMANSSNFDEQISLINLLNTYIVNFKTIDDAHFLNILEINEILHDKYKEKYETFVDPEFINYLIQVLGARSKSKKICDILANFITGVGRIRTKPFPINENIATMMLNPKVFPPNTCLNLIKNFFKLPENALELVRSNLLAFLLGTLTVSNDLIRQKSTGIVRELNDLMIKSPEIKAQVLKTSIKAPNNKIFMFLIAFLEEKENSSDESVEPFMMLLKNISLNRTMNEFQEAITDIPNVEGYIKGIATKSSNKNLRKLFTQIYENLSKNFSNEQKVDILENAQGNAKPSLAGLGLGDKPAKEANDNKAKIDKGRSFDA